MDSAYLLYAAAKYGEDVTAYFVRSEFQPSFEVADAVKLAYMLGVELRIIDMSTLEDDAIRANTKERCYLCKRRIFEAIISSAAADGYEVIADGSNLDDDPAQRPGMRALNELSVLSPLREAGLSKADVRRLSNEAGLFTWDKPSYSCLATRVPTGCPLDGEMLSKIERGETALMELGFSDFRLRWRSGGAKLELREEQLPLAISKRNDMLSALEEDFGEICLDLRSRE